MEKPRYCFASHMRVGTGETIVPKPIIVVEGLFLLWDPRIRSLLGLKIYADVEPDIRFIRRLRRDVLERGRSVESVITQYLQWVRPMHQAYVEPSKVYADLVLASMDSVGEAAALIDQAISKRIVSARGGGQASG